MAEMADPKDILVHLSGPKGEVDETRWVFWCPGCGCAHQIDGRWTLTGPLSAPTIRASILVQSPRRDGTVRCHSFVTDGKIQFLADSTHKLAGQTVPLVPWEDVP